jgi:exopolysaccharide biosynthesis WecB/TagA/CpsF family protein
MPTAQQAVALCVDDYDVEEFAAMAAHFGGSAFGYVVTPNVDHFIRYHDDASFRELYGGATHVLLDSRFLAYLLRLTRGVKTRVCPGSDLSAALLNAAEPDEPIVLIGATDAQAEALRTRFGLRRLAHHNPPMAFIRDQAAVDACLQFIEAHSPFRFCFLAVGSPQQEMIARELARRGIARGLALCVGASINFLTGVERRAPQWMQRLGLEWLFRLLQDPARLAARYLLRGPRIFVLLPTLRLEFRRARVSAEERSVPE